MSRGDEEKWIEEGLVCYRWRAFEKAIYFFKKVIEINPRNNVAWIHMGRAFEDLREFTQSITCYEKALKIESHAPLVLYNLGLVFRARGDSSAQDDITCNGGACRKWIEKRDEYYKRAVAYFEKALEIDPDNAMIWFELGRTYHTMGAQGDAEECYFKAVGSDPEYAEAWFALGDSYSNEYGEEAYSRTQAIEYYQKGLEISPENHIAWFNLGAVFSELGDGEKALKCRERAVAITAGDTSRLM